MPESEKKPDNSETPPRRDVDTAGKGEKPEAKEAAREASRSDEKVD
jgi:hypothetical protein